MILLHRWFTFARLDAVISSNVNPGACKGTCHCNGVTFLTVPLT